MYHGVPMAGDFSHGFVSYHPRCFRDLASANYYEVVDFWGVGFRGKRAPQRGFGRLGV